jgi:hypothetical protein
VREVGAWIGGGPQLVAGFDGVRWALFFWYRNDAGAEPVSLDIVMIYAPSGVFWHEVGGSGANLGFC